MVARSDGELRALLADLESDQVERKESLASKEKVCQAICAFANDLPDHRSPGVVFIGADDNGKPTNLDITDRLLRDLASLRDDGRILPLPMMSVRTMVFGTSEVVVVEVEPSTSPPVRFNGQVWVRVGPRRSIASADEERRLAERRRAADLPFDARPMPDATFDDLDLGLFERDYLPSALPPDVLDANERTRTQRLAALRLAALDGTATAAGLLVIGVEPTRFIPGAYVQFLRVEGTELATSIVDEKRLEAPLTTLLRLIDELLTLHIHTAVTIGTSAEGRQPDYPLAALQQLSRNAILHRNYESTASPVRITWYADRIEIFSPGGPYGAVTTENFGRPGVTDYRNPTLAEAMRSLGYVQRFGAGLPIVRRSLQENGNPPEEFAVDPAYVGVTVRPASNGGLP